MNIKVNTIGGGVFSKFMVAIQTINDLCDVDLIENIYINNNDSVKDGVNPFDFVLEQSGELNFDITLDAMSNHRERYNKYGSQVYTDIINETDLPKLKKICSKIRVKDIVLDRLLNISDDTLGVHIRLTDMNKIHPNYGVNTTNDYIEKIIDLIVNNESLNKIFISSDNEESLQKIKENKKINKLEILYNDVNNRHPNDSGGLEYIKFQQKNFMKESFWIDSFLDMLSLSKCGELLYKVSNLNNTSVIFSNSIRKTHRL